MIAADQPACFPDDLLVCVSSINDGTMLDKTRGTHASDIVAHRQKFCQTIGIAYDDVVYQRIVYDETQAYDRIREVNAADTLKHTPEVAADALYTGEKRVALMLPVADCVATVVYDSVCQVLALLHLGRHSTVAGLMQRGIDRFLQAGSRPQDLIVWMSPSAQAETYVMQYFDQADEPEWRDVCRPSPEGIHLDMQGYNAAVCQRAGVPTANIHRSPINTMTNPDYFSHARGDRSGRMAVVAMMR